MPDALSLHRDGPVATITMQSPEARNALTVDMAEALVEACAVVARDESVGAVVVRGAGGTFCSGADTRSWPQTYADPLGDEALRSSDALYGAAARLAELPVPTVAAVRGAAVGAGLNLALATDVRIVADDARLLAGFLRAGIHPGGGFFTLASRLGGPEAAAALGVFGQEVSGRRAVELGLAWEALADSEVDDRARRLAEGIAADPPLARRVIRSFRLETGAASMPLAAAAELERGAQLWTQARRARGDGAAVLSAPGGSA